MAVGHSRHKSLHRASGRPWLDVKGAAKHLDVGVDTIYLACASRGLKHIKIGHSTIRIKVEWLENWAESFSRQTS